MVVEKLIIFRAQEQLGVCIPELCRCGEVTSPSLCPFVGTVGAADHGALRIPTPRSQHGVGCFCSHSIQDNSALIPPTHDPALGRAAK